MPYLNDAKVSLWFTHTNNQAFVILPKIILIAFISIMVMTHTGFAAQSSTQQSNSVQKLVFGIVPQQSATQLAKNWLPLMTALSDRLQIPVQFATAKDIPTFEACLAKGAYDIAYMNPYHYIVFHDLSGYEAIAHRSDKKLNGIMVARKDSPIQKLEDITNASIAFPSPAAFGASVLPRAELKAKNIDFHPIYVKSHDSVYRSVVMGLHGVGGGVTRTFENLPDDIKNQLQIIYTTASYTPHAIAVKSEINGTLKEFIQESLVQLKGEVVEPLGITGFKAAEDKDWNDVRSLNLLVSHTKISYEDDHACHSG
jgi:phosphonate transport system substrate-binding protein